MNYHTNGPQHVNEVPKHGPILYVIDVKTSAFLFIQIISSGHLPRTSNARLDQKPCSINLIVFVHFELTLRTRTNNTHGSNERIEELRNLVQTGFSNEMTNLGDTRILFNFHASTHLLTIRCGDFSQMRVSIHTHGTELVNLKRLST